MSLCLSPSTCATVPTVTPSEVTTFHPCSICSHETGSVIVDHASTAKTHAYGLSISGTGRNPLPPVYYTRGDLTSADVARIDGARFDDWICGRREAEQIHPGGGKDVVNAGARNDVIFARDGKVDRISCGPGATAGTAPRRICLALEAPPRRCSL